LVGRLNEKTQVMADFPDRMRTAVCTCGRRAGGIALRDRI